MAAVSIPDWIEGDHPLGVHGRRLRVDLPGASVLVHPRKLTTVLGAEVIWRLKRRLGHWRVFDRFGTPVATARRVRGTHYEAASGSSRYVLTRSFSGDTRTLTVSTAAGQEVATIEAIFHKAKSAEASDTPTYTRAFQGHIKTLAPVESPVVALAIRLMAGGWSFQTPRAGSWRWDSLRDTA
jgi:hypothetical protein